MASARSGVERSLDHFVIMGSDPEVSGTQFERLGFQVMPLMRHIELGSCNRVAQFRDTYLEFVGDLDKMPKGLRDRVAPLAERGGIGMISLTSPNLETDAQHLSLLGVSVSPIVSARRDVKMPDGSIAQTASRSCYCWLDDQPLLTMFLSDHPSPEAIWIPEYQVHPNSAGGVAGLVIATPDVAAASEFLSQLLGFKPERLDSSEANFRTPKNQTLRLLSPEKTEASGRTLTQSTSMEVVEMETWAADLQKVRQQVRSAGVPFRQEIDSIVIPAAHAGGVCLRFSSGGTSQDAH